MRDMTNAMDYTDYTLSAASPDDLTAGLATLALRSEAAPRPGLPE